MALRYGARSRHSRYNNDYLAESGFMPLGVELRRVVLRDKQDLAGYARHSDDEPSSKSVVGGVDSQA